jgi:hypothetical protein
VSIYIYIYIKAEFFNTMIQRINSCFNQHWMVQKFPNECEKWILFHVISRGTNLILCNLKLVFNDKNK